MKPSSPGQLDLRPDFEAYRIRAHWLAVKQMRADYAKVKNYDNAVRVQIAMREWEHARRCKLVWTNPANRW